MGQRRPRPHPIPTPTPTSPSQMEKPLLLCLTCPTMRIIQVIFLIFLMAKMPERLRQQLDFVPIKCLLSDANGHKLLLRQPRHFASLTYSSLSIFFQTQTHRTLAHHAHVLLINFFPSRSRGEIPHCQSPLRALQNARQWSSFVSQTEPGEYREPQTD